MRGQWSICNHHHRHLVQLHHGSVVVNWQFANIILDQAEKKRTLETGNRTATANHQPHCSNVLSYPPRTLYTFCVHRPPSIHHLPFAGKRARPEITLLGRKMRANVKVKDIHGQPHSRTRIGNIDDTSHMALNRRTRQQEVDLVVVVTCHVVSKKSL